MSAFRTPATALAVIAAAGLLFAAHGPLQAQGHYSPVTKEDVPAMRLSRYFPPERKGREADFEWRFFKDGFVLKAGRGPIPADLREKLVEKGATAGDTSGKWRIEKVGGPQLVLTDSRAGKKQLNTKAGFRLYGAAPTVIRVGQPQYVFGIERVGRVAVEALMMRERVFFARVIRRDWLLRAIRISGDVEALIEYDARGFGLDSAAAPCIRLNEAEIVASMRGSLWGRHQLLLPAVRHDRAERRVLTGYVLDRTNGIHRIWDLAGAKVRPAQLQVPRRSPLREIVQRIAFARSQSC